MVNEGLKNSHFQYLSNWALRHQISTKVHYGKRMDKWSKTFHSRNWQNRWFQKYRKSSTSFNSWSTFMFKYWQLIFVWSYCFKVIQDNFMGFESLKSSKIITKSHLTLWNWHGRCWTLFGLYIKEWELKIQNICYLCR